MGFFTGRVSCTRFKVSGRAPRSFGPDQLAQLAAQGIDRQRLVSADGVLAGWIAADHILDTRFDLAKNIVNDALHFALRIDSQKVPGDLLRAYTLVELEGLASQNPSGIPSARQKREARMLAKERLEQEAKDGRYLRRQAIPILWDAPSNELLVGSSSLSVLDRLVTLFQQTFERKFEMLGAGRQAFGHAEVAGQTRGVDDARPTVFVPSQAHEVAWTPDEADRDFLGNEFLVWLWYFLEKEDDTLKLSDNSEVAIMLARTLVLECPRGQTGRQSLTSDGPAKLPEAYRALQAGKLPRKAGLTLVRHDQTYELTLAAESLAFSAAKLPPPEGDDDRARLDNRVGQLRALLETLDLIYAAFCERRLGSEWTKEVSKIKKWLQAPV